ncbi:hypothetical protein CspeluHIS016_0208850 [Cutaneotrichosporon spelunceum]|uniref:Uncharacterized protein n=1 Tax=Cutaneotrichosporon spelunceum TaxID=1672016 RepID=A0AAD3TS67_9TREE|nr:hypothetical protein CspeluHIS016_0208850 [Cutaneotrichosporon spelunceum]
MDLNKTLIVSLENRLRIVRNAINLDKSKNDGVVEGRVHTWRDAGREVTDMLFSLLPRPNEGCECGVKPPQWDDCGYGNDLHTHGFTPEQLQYLVNAPTDANGDILDEAGNRVFGDNDDIGPFIKQALPLGRHTSTTPPYHAERYHMPKIDHSTWDRGAMLQRLGVDPDLLGWDREAEDWMETGECSSKQDAPGSSNE